MTRVAATRCVRVALGRWVSVSVRSVSVSVSVSVRVRIRVRVRVRARARVDGSDVCGSDEVLLGSVLLQLKNRYA